MVSEPNIEPSELLVELRKEFEEQRDSGGPFWVDASVRGDHIVVVYRDRIGSPLIGRRYNVRRLSALFEPAQSATALAEILVTSDFVPPSTGGGKEMRVDWADGLNVSGQKIQWVNS